MAKKKTKLELTWIGKDNRPKLEPRILIEDPEKSYHAAERHSENDIFDNRLIFGDNLLALKALEQEYTGKIKCVYIDPPYNTGSAFEHYDDGLEHSQWLNLMKPRLEMLWRLLSPDGAIFISIDNNEVSYLQVLMDEIFERKNRKNMIVVKRGSVTGAKVINPGLVNVSEFILVYTKDANEWAPNRQFRKRERDTRYGTIITNHDDHYSKWEFATLLDEFAKKIGIKKSQLRKTLNDDYERLLEEFMYENAERVIQFVTLDEKSISKAAVNLKTKSKENREVVYKLERKDRKPYYIYNSKLILFVKDRLNLIDGELTLSEPLTDIWDDALPNDLHNEGGVDFRKGKKPEKLIQRIIAMSTNEGDLVLDSFLGSGTTAAVAHKMRRRWIGVELGEHCYTHCIPRLQAVIDDADTSGISKPVNWQGGGGFRYYRLGPSLIVKDEWDNPVINQEFNPAMLAEAVCKLEGFTYAPSEETYWIHGQSTEQDFIYITTQFMSKEMLAKISDEVGSERSLLICCAAFRCNPSQFPNLTLKKIPKAVLKKCEWGHDDYSLEIKNLPDAPPPELEDSQEDEPTKPRRKFGKENKQQPNLFGEGGDQ